ncbi:winged helix-turn-helix transcriptional regulator [Streptomyces sp. PLAI1-29]|uniref:Winged helix-turn-helix transcriptional regulator n=2 Tax=Streptomyces zingiberis TaxID=2053010 RepID=A0ABX1BUN6_9ACTN|nr:winged helix-turn-helix transcriptional regulator [Streptomyces zingiberis]
MSGGASYELRFGAGGVPRCRFAVSPLWETLSAVRALDRPGGPGTRLPWLRRIQVAATGLDLAPLALLTPVGGPAPGFLTPRPEDPYTRIDDELSRVRTADPALARGQLEHALTRTPGAAGSLRGRRMLDDPGRAVKELADLLELAWRALIEPDWPRLHDLLEADTAFHARRLSDGGPEALFAELHPHVRWTGSVSALTVANAEPGPPEPEDAGLLLVPSVFCRPDPLAGAGAPWRRALVYPARGAGGLWERPAEHPPEVLARLLGRGRAAVLTALEEPASTTGLARRLGLAPSSVSAHLSALRDAGLLTSHRYGHQVLYERTPLGIALAAG